MGKLKKLCKNWRVLLLLGFLLLALLAIRPDPFAKGVAIRQVLHNSSASAAGIENPEQAGTPLQKERITELAQQQIRSLEDYTNVLAELEPNQTITLKTNRNVYPLVVAANEPDLGLRVSEISKTNIRKGLDLEGGTRVLLQPVSAITDDELDLTIAILNQRLNVFGLSDVIVRAAKDLAGQKFILIEIAGATQEEVKDLIAKQGKFEAKIKNQTVFLGGQKDITYVCRTAECSGIDPQRGCGLTQDDGWACGFFFSITLSPEAAQKQAQITSSLSVVQEQGGARLSSPLELYLDDILVDTLQIGAELKGKPSTQVQISGSGVGNTQQEAVNDALQNMKKLQTVLITGSLPVKLEMVKIDTISPLFGKELLSNALFVGVLALVGVSLIIALRYRTAKIVLPIVFTLFSEVMLILGFAALVGWNLDLAAIAGIIISIGTGVDHLVIITDETLRGEGGAGSWKEKIKRALFIIFGAYFTGLASMLPIWFAGAGLLKGFAFTTVVGLSVGVLIARPAYAKIIEIVTNE